MLHLHVLLFHHIFSPYFDFTKTHRLILNSSIESTKLAGLFISISAFFISIANTFSVKNFAV